MSAWLLGAGALGLETLDADSLEPLPDLATGWAELRASFDGDGAHRPEALLQAVGRELEQLGLAGERVRLLWLDAQDWADNWKAHFTPVRVGRFLIHPGWEQADQQARWSVRIDPGMAFGTGLHPSTRLCLAALDAWLGGGQSQAVLDVGCGSGVLAIAAAMAGARPVVAVDTDLEACRVTRQNAIHNGQAEFVEVHQGGPEVAAGAFDLVLANILSGMLVSLRAALVARLAPGGILVLSGLLTEEADGVADAFMHAGLRLIGSQDCDGWSALTLAPSSASGALV